MVRRSKKEVLCEKTPRLLIGIFLLGLVSTAPMVSKSIKIERCSQHLVWFREPCGFYSNSDGKCIIMRIRGRRNNIPYVPFEALKARDLRLEPVPHHYYYEDIRKDLKKPQRLSGVSRATLFILFDYLLFYFNTI